MKTYHKIRSSRYFFTLLNFAYTQVGCAMVVGSLLGNTPSHVHNLKLQSIFLTTNFCQLWVNRAHKRIPLFFCIYNNDFNLMPCCLNTQEIRIQLVKI